MDDLAQLRGTPIVGNPHLMVIIISLSTIRWLEKWGINHSNPSSNTPNLARTAAESPRILNPPGANCGSSAPAMVRVGDWRGGGGIQINGNLMITQRSLYIIRWMVAKSDKPPKGWLKLLKP